MQARNEARGSALEVGESSLSLLSPNVALPQRGERIEEILITSIQPNARQVRTHFNEERIAELAESIKAHGLMQPLVVRALAKSPGPGLLGGNAQFELIAGERRLRALKRLGRAKAPAIIRQVSDDQMRILALVENVQREDLGVLEKAAAVIALRKEIGTVERVAELVQKSRAYAFMYARIGDLPENFQGVIAKKDLSAEDADVLAAILKDAEKSGDDKKRFIVERTLLEGKFDRADLKALRERFFGKGNDKTSRSRSTQKLFWKTKRDVNLRLRWASQDSTNVQGKKHLAQEAERFFKAIGARRCDITF